MKTENLVAMLAANVEAVSPKAASRQIGLALAASLPLSFLLLAMGYGVRSDLSTAIGWPMFWVKLLVPACVAVFGFTVTQRLARPGVLVRQTWMGLLAPILFIWALGVIVLMTAPPADRAALIMGQTWRSCAFSITAISAPVFVAALWSLKRLAPTRPAVAGAAAGAMSSGSGAAIYALHCPEMAAPFLAVWYVAGMSLPALLGALIGPRLLRW
ncbi:DUF1109 domain-containing protein [Pigmentiphaga aceris]|uniref:DUF1109 domain-containing protein n=1 Tax=Pigmentiphaga aceris TaxID=1940612 RepID=A0A5C0AZD1_9BURK|nr:DUF1109 domain-containing protein [Pigmentiphaga aceris]QEI06210.1 DUF1109 domain-containing protein [Pigmentiphaga aceris]